MDMVSGYRRPAVDGVLGVSGTGTRGEAAHWSILMDMVSYRRPAMDGVVGVSGTG